MGKRIKATVDAACAAVLVFLLALPGASNAALKSMSDDDLSGVSGQALFMASTESQGGYDFFKMGLDTLLELNTNIEELKLGNTSQTINGLNTDLWIKNLALGCVADASNNCVDSESGAATHLKPFSLLRPFVQIATKGSGTTREVVGIRLGAQNAQGPFSAGNLLAFSGYLSGKANVEMQEMGGGTGPGGSQRNNPLVDTLGNPNKPSGCSGNLCRGVAVTNDSDFYRADRWNIPGNNSKGWNFGFSNQCWFVLIANVCTREVLAKFDAQVKNNLPVIASGRRINQALIHNMYLADTVDALVDSVGVTATTEGLGQSILDAFLPIFKGSMSNNIKNQMASYLGISTAQLNNYRMPFNLENFHSVEVNSSLFGISFQKENGVQYPGYSAPMTQGWTMYLPDAFELNISQPTVAFIANMGTGGARAGNIVNLPVNGGGVVYDNCWGTSKFC